MRLKKEQKAYLTVYLSLMLPLLLSFFFTFLYGAKKSAMKMQIECVADIGLNAVLSEYNRELFSQYDLLFVDMSYGGQKPSIHNTTARLRHYLLKNLNGFEEVWGSREFLNTSLEEAEILQYSLATDDGGEVMKRQIVDYYEHTAEGILNDLLPEAKGLDADFWDADVSEERENNQRDIDSIDLPEIETETGEMEEVELGNPADVANRTRSGGILGLVLPDTGKISCRQVEVGQLASHRSLAKGDGLSEEAKAVSGSCSELLFHRYLFDKLGFYGQELEKGALAYQIEYLIAGKDSDWDNLEAVCNRILLGREAVNVAYIFTDSGKVAEAEAWAAGLTAVILTPELLEPVKISLLLAWAYVESLQDLRILLEGGKVPVQKTEATWHTSLEDILHIKSSLRSINNPSGLEYKEYLSGLLFTVSDNTKTFRTMDVMEMDIRRTEGNHFFRMDGCTDCILAKMSTSNGLGIEVNLERRYGYYYSR